MAAIRPKKEPSTICPTEDAEQTKLVAWLDKNHIIHYAIPNGGKRSFAQGCKLKRTGVKAGVPDLCIPVPSNTYHGLYIELKRISGGVLSQPQRDWLVRLRRQGYCAEVCKGFNEAKAIVMEYLNMYNDIHLCS